jgi:hypothetical protein
LPGPEITYFGITTADNHVIAAELEPDSEGRPIFTRLFGAGFFLVVESKAGDSNSPPDTRNFYTPSDPASRPDVQILASNDLGNGSSEVCDKGPFPFPIGGVPGFPQPDFDPGSQTVTDALNDIGCRLNDNTTAPCSLNDREIAAFVKPGISTTQVCSDTVVGNELHFPQGDTVVTVQWRDRAGNIGRPYSIVIRVQSP